MVPLLGAGLVRSLGAPRALHMRVGGLPQAPKPPLNYRLFFAVQGLINEYIEPCRVIRNGRVEIVPGLSELEELAFPKPFGVLEAFQTSGGTSTLIETLAGEVDELTYKTIRYPGHCAELRLLEAVGFFSTDPVEIDGATVTPRAFTETMLTQRLSEPTPDVVLCRIVATGVEDGEAVRIVEELVDHPDETRGLSAMARCTGYPAAIITQMLGKGVIDRPGAVPQENVVPVDVFRTELEKRDIVFTRRVQHADGTPA
jgi:lysine 6-dehydrogenase